MIAIGGLGITEIILILYILIVYVLPAVAVVVIIRLLWRLLQRQNRVSALESRVEHLERQLNRQSEPSSSKSD
jgi:cell division protein FtsL